MEVFNDLCVSEKLSENKELLRFGIPPVAEAAERLGGGLLRRPPGRGLAGRSSFNGGGSMMLEGRPVAMMNDGRGALRGVPPIHSAQRVTTFGCRV